MPLWVSSSGWTVPILSGFQSNRRCSKYFFILETIAEVSPVYQASDPEESRTGQSVPGAVSRVLSRVKTPLLTQWQNSSCILEGHWPSLWQGHFVVSCSIWCSAGFPGPFLQSLFPAEHSPTCICTWNCSIPCAGFCTSHWWTSQGSWQPIYPACWGHFG